jgi:hypothetical protein
VEEQNLFSSTSSWEKMDVAIYQITGCVDPRIGVGTHLVSRPFGEVETGIERAESGEARSHQSH